LASAEAALPRTLLVLELFEITQEFDSIGLTNCGLLGVALVPVLVDGLFSAWAPSARPGVRLVLFDYRSGR